MNPSSGIGNIARHVIWTAGATVVVLSVWLLDGPASTTYGGTAAPWRATEAVAASALLVAGTLVAPVRRILGLATAALGLSWLLAEWAGWTAAPGWLRAALLAWTAVLVSLATLTVAVAGGLTGRARRTALSSVAAGAVVVVVAHLVLLDPFADHRCWRTCRPNTLAVGPADGLGDNLRRAGVGVICLVALLVLGSLGWRSVRERRPALSWWSVLGATAMLSGLAVSEGLRLVVVEDPEDAAFAWSFVAANGGAMAWSVGLCVDRWRERRLQSAIFRLVDDVRAAPPGTLERELARAIGDPSLRLFYWSATRRSYVDAEGRPADPLADGQTTLTAVVRDRDPVAALSHSRQINGSRVERAMGPAVRLSLENEQLRAATLAELAELKASRTRIVEHADAERRRIERNLHDGAQQRVVGIALLLRMVRTRLGGRDAAPEMVVLANAEALVEKTLDDLRRLVAGVHPAVLTHGGLQAAVPDLVESSTDLRVRVEALPSRRHPSGVEATAYLVVAESFADARRRAATKLSITFEEVDGKLVAEVVDDAPLGSVPHAAAEFDDRVGSLDGRLTVGAVGGGGTCVRVELPCGS